MKYFLILFVLALAIAPLTHFLPSKRQRQIARMREYAALHGMFVEFRKLEGVTGVLISEKSRDEIYKIKEMVTYIELNVNQEFMNNFNAAKFIPHTDRSLFPSVKEWGVI